MNDLLIFGNRYRDLFGSALSEYFDILYLPDNPDVAAPLAGHTDLSLFNTGFSLICAQYLKNHYFAAELSARGVLLDFDSTVQFDVYPFDCSLNAAFTDDYFVYNPRTCSDRVSAAMLNEIRIPVRVKQGYVRCSALFTGARSCITADKGIADALKAAGCEVLLISAHGVQLPGYDCGFIGGASFFHNGTVYFFGDVSLHPSYEIIKEFLSKQGIRIISLSSDPLLDVGGAIILDNKRV